MRYLSRERLFGLFLQVGRSLEFELRETEGKNEEAPTLCDQNAQNAHIAARTLSNSLNYIRIGSYRITRFSRLRGCRSKCA